jgi:toxin YoeB
VNRKHAKRRKSAEGPAHADKDRRKVWAAVFQSEFREDLRYWFATNPQIANRVLDLVEAVMQDPFNGIGKPEPLKYDLAGCWSRRVTQEHRLVYLVRENRVDFLQSRYHY